MTASEQPITERQRRAISVLCSKAGVNVPELLGQYTRAEASAYITKLEELVDGSSDRLDKVKPSSAEGGIAHRARTGLATKLVYSRLARSGKDPLELETFQDEVLAVYDVLLELEEAR